MRACQMYQGCKSQLVVVLMLPVVASSPSTAETATSGLTGCKNGPGLSGKTALVRLAHHCGGGDGPMQLLAHCLSNAQVNCGPPVFCCCLNAVDKGLPGLAMSQGEATEGEAFSSI